MALPNVTPLDELQLDRRLLHLFVLGPGQGEGIAIALPDSGWVLIDGCRAPRQRAREPFPLEKVTATFGSDDDVVAMVLTHPHRDHVHGFAELVEELMPGKVAITGFAEGVTRTLADEADACEERRLHAKTTGERAVAAAVLTALRGINTWAEDHPDSLVALCDGSVFLDGNATIVARAPHETILRGWFDDGKMAEIMASRANALSTVLEVTFGDVSIILGGDLPVKDGTGTIATGWDRVLASHEHLVHHGAMKVPHHGSRDALHGDLIKPVPKRSRAWMLTPYNSSSLPRLNDDDGLEQLLEGQSPVMLTAPSLSTKLFRAHRDGRTTPSDLQAMQEALQTDRWDKFQAGDTVVRLERYLEPLAPLWCVAFDESGIVGRWRGKAALEVHRP